MTHDAEIVRDEDVGQAEPLLQILQQVDDLRLDRDVERRYRLVADDQLGLDGERAADRDPLRLAAAQLVRIALDQVTCSPTMSSSSRMRRRARAPG